MTPPAPAPGVARLMGLRPLHRAGLAVLAGLAAALGLAPFDLWPLAFPAFALLIALVASAPGRRAAASTAWIGGAAYFALALHWIVEPFFVEPERYGWMAPFALVLMAGGLALFWLLAGAAAARVVPAPSPLRAVAAAGTLTLAEALRGVAFTGFPWAEPGHSLIASDLLAAAAWLGPDGLTLVLLGAAAGTAALALSGRPWRAGLPILAGIGLGFAPLTPAPPAPDPDAPVLRVVQPNAPQHLKWRADMIPVFFRRGLDLTARPSDPDLGDPDLVIWPETSLPVILDRSDVARARISEAAGPAEVILGAQRFRGVRPVNALAHLDAEGQIAAVYDKHRLVPFGEYLPMGDLLADFGLRGMAEVLPGGYVPGDGPAALALGPGLGRAFAMICYEAIFPGYIRAVPRPDWIVHITNDAWFGTFSGPWQHLALARLRAAEQGLPVIRAANTGISAVIDARGTVVAALPLGAAGHLDHGLPAALPATLFSRTGRWPTLLLAAFVTLAAAAAARRQKAH